VIRYERRDGAEEERERQQEMQRRESLWEFRMAGLGGMERNKQANEPQKGKGRDQERGKTGHEPMEKLRANSNTATVVLSAGVKKVRY